jgi:hypothetical protein
MFQLKHLITNILVKIKTFLNSHGYRLHPLWLTTPKRDSIATFVLTKWNRDQVLKSVIPIAALPFHNSRQSQRLSVYNYKKDTIERERRYTVETSVLWISRKASLFFILGRKYLKMNYGLTIKIDNYPFMVPPSYVWYILSNYHEDSICCSSISMYHFISLCYKTSINII